MLFASMLIFVTCGKDEAGDETVLEKISDAEYPNDNSVNTTNIGCSIDPLKTSIYDASVSGDVKTIITNTYLNHRYSKRAMNVTVEDLTAPIPWTQHLRIHFFKSK